MKRSHLLVPLACASLGFAFALGTPEANVSASTQNGAVSAATSLFDGRTLQGWRGYRQADAAGTRWSVQDGTLTLPPKAAGGTRARDIITVDTYDHFDLAWEWKVAPGGNSGLKYYVLEDSNSAIGHEYQILDDQRHADAKIGAHRQTASLYDVLAPMQPRPVKPAGEWNTSRVVAAPGSAPGGTRVAHYLNGTKVLEYELDSPELRAAIAKSKFKDVSRFGKLHKGHILLQDHNDQVWYRNIRIQRLGQS